MSLDDVVDEFKPESDEIDRWLYYEVTGNRVKREEESDSKFFINHSQEKDRYGSFN